MSNALSGRVATAEGHVPRRQKLPKWVAVGLIAGPVLFTVAWLILGFVNTGYTLWDIRVHEYSPITQPISGLGLGNTAPYMNTAFVVSGLLIIAGAFGFLSQIPDMEDRTRWIYGGLLALHGAGAVIDGVFTLESADLHFFGFLLAISPIVTFPILGRRLRRIPEWRRFGTWLIWASPMTVVLVAAFFATFIPTGADTGIAGLTQRLLVMEIQAWLVVMGWLAVRPIKETHRAAAR